MMGPQNGTGTSPVNSRGWWGIPTAKERGPYVFTRQVRRRSGRGKVGVGGG
jgi:hypothetical protein